MGGSRGVEQQLRAQRGVKELRKMRRRKEGLEPNRGYEMDFMSLCVNGDQKGVKRRKLPGNKEKKKQE